MLAHGNRMPGASMACEAPGWKSLMKYTRDASGSAPGGFAYAEIFSVTCTGTLLRFTAVPTARQQHSPGLSVVGTVRSPLTCTSESDGPVGVTSAHAKMPSPSPIPPASSSALRNASATLVMAHPWRASTVPPHAATADGGSSFIAKPRKASTSGTAGQSEAPPVVNARWKVPGVPRQERRDGPGCPGAWFWSCGWRGSLVLRAAPCGAGQPAAAAPGPGRSPAQEHLAPTAELSARIRRVRFQSTGHGGGANRPRAGRIRALERWRRVAGARQFGARGTTLRAAGPFRSAVARVPR
jgi:hypothetical protein